MFEEFKVFFDWNSDKVKEKPVWELRQPSYSFKDAKGGVSKDFFYAMELVSRAFEISTPSDRHAHNYVASVDGSYRPPIYCTLEIIQDYLAKVAAKNEILIKMKKDGNASYDFIEETVEKHGSQMR